MKLLCFCKNIILKQNLLRGKHFLLNIVALENFEFDCDVWAIPEGTPIFPHEPLITVRGDFDIL